MEQGKTHVPTLYFDQTQKKWAQGYFKDSDIKINKDVSKLTFITYNIWFDRHNISERGVELRKIMESSDADFICLQEVIQFSYQELLNTPWVQKYYISGNTLSGYITLILSKYPCHFYFCPWPTNMARYLIYAQLELNGKPTAVGTVHLESLGNPLLRKTQLDKTYEEFKKYDVAFLMGDFNFDFYGENKNIIPEYTDVWAALHPDDPGFTMKRCSNFLAWRPDRFIMKRNKKWEALSIERVGTESIPIYKEIVKKRAIDIDEITTPSDHYGLKIVVNCSKGGETKQLEKVLSKGNIFWASSTSNNESGMEEIDLMKEQLRNIAPKNGWNVRCFNQVTDLLEDFKFRLDKIEDATLVFDFLSLFSLTRDWGMYWREIRERFSGTEENKLRVIALDPEGNSSAYKDLFGSLKVKQCKVVDPLKLIESLSNGK